MRIAFSLLALAAVAALTGCAGPERKFGRGVSNMSEIIRGSEMRRAREQTGLWEGSSMGPTAFAHGFTRTMTRTGIGIYEVVTFPIPPYGPLLAPKGKLYPDSSIKTRNKNWGGLELPEKPVFPDSYKPGLFEDSIFATDTSIGFSGGDVAPFIPGSRFRVFDN